MARIITDETNRPALSGYANTNLKDIYIGTHD